MTSCLEQTVDEIVTEITMSFDQLPWLIIEGISDNKFFVTKNLPNNPKPVVAKGWENVVGVIAKVIEENITATVFGFIDRDYRLELGVDIDVERIVVSDFRDLEISMFESDSLHRILVELGSENKLPAIGDGIDLDLIKRKIYSVSSIMGKLRFYSLKNNLRISFRKLNFVKFVDPNTLDINYEMLLQQINSINESEISMEHIEKSFEEKLPEKLIDCKYICSGHDVIEILGISLKKLWGTNNSKDVSRKILEKHLRIGYSNDEFERTEMFNKLFKLLKKEI